MSVIKFSISTENIYKKTVKGQKAVKSKSIDGLTIVE